MVPRCYAFLVMMGYWLLHSLIDWNDVEGMRDQHKDALRDHILRKDGPVCCSAPHVHACARSHSAIIFFPTSGACAGPPCLHSAAPRLRTWPHPLQGPRPCQGQPVREPAPRAHARAPTRRARAMSYATPARAHTAKANDVAHSTIRCTRRVSRHQHKTGSATHAREKLKCANARAVQHAARAHTRLGRAQRTESAQKRSSMHSPRARNWLYLRSCARKERAHAKIYSFMNTCVCVCARSQVDPSALGRASRIYTDT